METEISLGNVTTTQALRNLHRALDEVNVDNIARDYREIIRRIRAEGIDLSDRRVIKLLKLIAASSLRRKSMEANPGDFWVLKHVWNNPDQIPHLQTIVDPYLEAYTDVKWKPERDLETIAAEITTLEARHRELYTDADYADFLHQAERLRQEILRHSEDAEARELLLTKIKGLIEAIMQILEQ